MDVKSVLVRDLQTNEIKSFEFLKDVAGYVGITELRGHWVEKNRMIKGRFVVGYNKDTLMEIKPVKAKLKTFYVYDIVDKSVSKRECSNDELMREFNLKKYQLEDCLFKGFLNNKRYGFSYDGDKLDFYLSKIKPPKEVKPKRVKKEKPIRVKKEKVVKVKVKKEKVVKQKKKPTFVVFDLEKNTTKKREGYLTEIAEGLSASRSYVTHQIRLKKLIKKRYAISTTEEDYQYYKDLYLSMKYKKTNAQLRKEKPDMAFNGEFKKPEPNKPAVRIGKHGYSKIREMLGIKDK